MELTKNQEKFQKVIAETLVEAWENETFKQELMESPIESMEKLTGEKINFKENTKVVVTDQSDSSTFYFNIPSKPELDDLELTEEQLELVAGGGWKGAVIGGILGSVAGPWGAVAGAAAGHFIEEMM